MLIIFPLLFLLCASVFVFALSHKFLFVFCSSAFAVCCVCQSLSRPMPRERERVLSLSSTSLNFPRLQRFSSTSLLFSSHSFLRLFFYCWRFVFLLSLYVILFSLFMHFRCHYVSSHNFIDFHFNSTDNFFSPLDFDVFFFLLLVSSLLLLFRHSSQVHVCANM